jgi:putative flippase GtrA
VLVDAGGLPEILAQALAVAAAAPLAFAGNKLWTFAG